MTDSVIEAAKSGRAKCGGCKKKIDMGELRFGAFNERWESYRWYHLVCGAALDADPTPTTDLVVAQQLAPIGCRDCTEWMTQSCIADVCLAELLAAHRCRGGNGPCDAENAALSACSSASVAFDQCRRVRMARCAGR